MKRWLKSGAEIYIFGMLLVPVILTSRAIPGFAELADVPSTVQVVRYIPSPQELTRLQSAGVKFLFVQLASYPEQFQARDLASFAGNLTLLIVAGQAPNNYQTEVLNEFNGPVYLFLQGIPDTFGIYSLARLNDDVKLYIMSHVYPGIMDVLNLNRIPHPYTLAVSGGLPDGFAADRLNELSALTRLILTTNAYPDQWSLRNINRIRRATALFINRASGPGSSNEAESLAALNTNFSVFIGRSFSVQWVLDGLLATVEYP